MPALSPTMEEGTLAKWHVKVGDTVASGDVIAEIETDKATMEVEAVDEGVVSELLVDAGAQGVKVGTVIARLNGEGGAKPAPDPKAEAAAPPPTPEPAKPAPAPQAESLPPSPSVRRIAEEQNLDLSMIPGTGKEGRVTKGDALKAANGKGDRVFASPRARAVAAE